MPIILSLLIVFIAILHLYHNWRIQPHSLYLSAALGIIAIVFITHYYFIYGTSVEALAFFFIHFTPLQFLLGPFLLFYVRGTLSDQYRLRRRDAWHFVPALLDFAFRSWYYFMPWSYKLGLASEMVQDIRRLHEIGNQFFPPTQIMLPLRFVSNFGYTLFALWMVLMFRRHYPSRKSIPVRDAQPVIRFLFYMLGACLLAELSFLVLVFRFFTDKSLGVFSFINDPLLLFSALGIVSIPILVQMYPQILYGIPSWHPARPQPLEALVTGQETIASTSQDGESEDDLANNTSQDAAAHFEELAVRIRRCMDEDQPWLDPDFSLETLAGQLNVPRHHLYYCFNKILNTRFIQLRSACRIRHAQQLIDQGAMREKTLEAIGLECGFSSRGTFMTTFREITGMTPREYLRSGESDRRH
jgi:AraC-like DNA-binding protein